MERIGRVYVLDLVALTSKSTIASTSQYLLILRSKYFAFALLRGWVCRRSTFFSDVRAVCSFPAIRRGANSQCPTGIKRLVVGYPLGFPPGSRQAWETKFIFVCVVIYVLWANIILSFCIWVVSSPVVPGRRHVTVVRRPCSWRVQG